MDLPIFEASRRFWHSAVEAGLGEGGSIARYDGARSASRHIRDGGVKGREVGRAREGTPYGYCALFSQRAPTLGLVG